MSHFPVEEDVFWKCFSHLQTWNHLPYWTPNTKIGFGTDLARDVDSWAHSNHLSQKICGLFNFEWQDSKMLNYLFSHWGRYLFSRSVYLKLKPETISTNQPQIPRLVLKPTLQRMWKHKTITTTFLDSTSEHVFCSLSSGKVKFETILAENFNLESCINHGNF